MRYYKGHIALSDARDVPILLHVRNARAICFDQLCDLLSLEIISERPRSLRWRLARLEQAGLVTRLQGQTHLRTPVFGITQQGLIFLESRGHYLLSLPSTTEAILHPSQVPHALEMVNIRLAFAKAGVLHFWKSDLEIASKNLVLENGAAKDFDAVAGIEVDGTSRTIGIEYERNPKAAARYRAIREVFERTIFAKRSIGPSMAAGTSYSEYGLSLPGYLFGRRYLSIWKVAETARQLSRNWIALTTMIRPWS